MGGAGPRTAAGWTGAPLRLVAFALGICVPPVLSRCFSTHCTMFSYVLGPEKSATLQARLGLGLGLGLGLRLGRGLGLGLGLGLGSGPPCGRLGRAAASGSP